MLTGRDAAHKRLLVELLDQWRRTLPEGVKRKDRFIYYVGPVRSGSARKWWDRLAPLQPREWINSPLLMQLLEQTGLLGMIGKAERGQVAIDAIKAHQAVYLMAVGGAAYLVSKAIKQARVLAFAELGMEAIYEFEVVDMPVTVAVDSSGSSVHQTGPAKWYQIIHSQ